ncbi:MAG: hypothetical protein LBF69_00980 [Prevotellaceae bacterium]|jgi:hypothetical protein|nr:hypothetical protein [Prevotellaceae bacterium]
MKKLFLLSALLQMLLLAGCSKDETATDPRDQYVGNYNYTEVGSISINQGGSVLGTVPITGSGNAIVTLSGENELSINGMVMTLSGNKLLPITRPFNENSSEYNISMNGTQTSQGTVSVGMITINHIISGAWTQGSSVSGTLSGTIVTTLTKQ